MTVIRVERAVDAPAPLAWAVVSDVEAIGDYAANVSRAETHGADEGMHRRCWNTAGDHWDEECRLWEPGRRYAFAVDTGTSGERMHRLFSSFVGTFAVEPRDDGALVRAEFDLEPRFGPVGALAVRLVRPRARRGVAAMVDNWAAEIESRHATRTAAAAE